MNQGYYNREVIVLERKKGIFFFFFFFLSKVKMNRGYYSREVIILERKKGFFFSSPPPPPPPPPRLKCTSIIIIGRGLFLERKKGQMIVNPFTATRRLKRHQNKVQG